MKKNINRKKPKNKEFIDIYGVHAVVAALNNNNRKLSMEQDEELNNYKNNNDIVDGSDIVSGINDLNKGIREDNKIDILAQTGGGLLDSINQMEKLNFKNYTVYLDGAHNVAGAKQLANFLKIENKKTWLIFGMLNNKDLLSYLKIIKPITLGVIAIKIKGEKNSFTPQQISMCCSKLNIACFKKKSIKDANNF